MRALLTALQDWVVDDVEPPGSQYPRFADGNLVSPAKVAFPAIPDVRSPHDRDSGVRVANPWLDGNGGGGTALPMSVPQVDASGNETSGIRHLEVSIPLATYTGWNVTIPDEGDPIRAASPPGAHITSTRAGEPSGSTL